MKIFKFGGASVKNADAIRNITNILNEHVTGQTVVVISAMGKTTNSLEALYSKHLKLEDFTKELNEVIQFHLNIINDLFENSKEHPVRLLFEKTINELKSILDEAPIDNHKYQYDQIVSFGELLSTKIISHYLYENGVDNRWLGAKSIIRTDNRYREASIDWETTNKLIQSRTKSLFEETKIIITQGFIGATAEKLTTTLGREGSDFTAAIIGAALNADDVTVWKDVPGILTGDPKKFPNAVKMNKITYQEAIEMTYYGAKVLHPKTIKPLENKGIPLVVRSFIDPKMEGTIIEKLDKELTYEPITILEENQVLLLLETKDLNFLSEEDLSKIYACCSAHQLKVNLMQHSATRLKLVVDNKDYKLIPVVKELKERFSVKTTDNLELLTIRHYNYEVIFELSKSRSIVMEYKSNNTYQLLFKN